jgi:NADH dehydrogenase FAD-containing subunit
MKPYSNPSRDWELGLPKSETLDQNSSLLILGGGLGGLYGALEFEKRHDPVFEVTLISQETFFLFTPMLDEVAASDLDVSSDDSDRVRIRQLLRLSNKSE